MLCDLTEDPYPYDTIEMPILPELFYGPWAETEPNAFLEYAWVVHDLCVAFFGSISRRLNNS